MELLTVGECADRLGIAESTLRGWIAERKLESIKVEGIVRIRASALEDFIADGVRPAKVVGE
jgi:excisionase family DNA binding protein